MVAGMCAALFILELHQEQFDQVVIMSNRGRLDRHFGSTQYVLVSSSKGSDNKS